jgi:hypothetical protein
MFRRCSRQVRLFRYRGRPTNRHNNASPTKVSEAVNREGNMTKHEKKCLHCAWMRAIKNKYPNLSRLTADEEKKLNNEVVNSAVAIAGYAMTLLAETERAKFLVSITKHASRIEELRAGPIGILQALLRNKDRKMSLEEFKAMLESINQPKN